MGKSLKGLTKQQSTLWHLQRLQLDLHQHVTDLTISKDARSHLEKASQSIASARITLEATSKTPR